MPLDDRARTPADVPVAEMERLLSLALARGGAFADLYFEHETTSSLLLEEGIIRTASAGVTCGLGVRVVSGERTGLRLHRRPVLAGDGASGGDGRAHRLRLEDAAAPARLARARRATLRRDERRRPPARRAHRARRARRPRGPRPTTRASRR